MKLHIGNLSKTVSDDQLTTIAGEYGATTTVTIVRDKRDGESRGFAFVDYAVEEHARAALTGLDGRDVDGRVLRVTEARPEKILSVPQPH